MWQVFESHSAVKVLKKAPLEVRENYGIWLDTVRELGPPGLRLIQGLHDEALRGEWKGYRSSRLNRKWRVIYRAIAEEVTVHVERVSAHDYR